MMVVINMIGDWSIICKNWIIMFWIWMMLLVDLVIKDELLKLDIFLFEKVNILW